MKGLKILGTINQILPLAEGTGTCHTSVSLSPTQMEGISRTPKTCYTPPALRLLQGGHFEAWQIEKGVCTHAICTIFHMFI